MRTSSAGHTPADTDPLINVPVDHTFTSDFYDSIILSNIENSHINMFLSNSHCTFQYNTITQR